MANDPTKRFQAIILESSPELATAPAEKTPPAPTSAPPAPVPVGTDDLNPTLHTVLRELRSGFLALRGENRDLQAALEARIREVEYRLIRIENALEKILTPPQEK